MDNQKNEKEGEERRKMEVIVMPFNGQGHLNTMLQFAKRLAWKGANSINVTLATTLSTTQKMTKSSSINNTIKFSTIYDDSEDAQLDFKARMDNFETQAYTQLSHLLSTSAAAAANCLLVYDANLPWALDVAKKHGFLAAAFFTQNCAYVASFYQTFLEQYEEDVDHPVIVAAKQSVNPPLPEDVPTPEELERGLPNPQFFQDTVTTGKRTKKKIHPIIRMVISHLSNIHLADWVLFNSFDHLEDEVIKWMTNLWPVRTIGPTVPSSYLDKRVENDVDYGFNLFKPNNESCMNWLNAQQAASVVYVAFGSAVILSVEQMAELAEALKQIPSSFLWVVRENEQKKLPEDFLSETSHKGLVLSWCPQLDVLAHEAVGCFITHCGWNSTIEALSFGVPMLAMPLFMDQLINAHFVDQVWGVGIKPKKNEKELITCTEIKHCLEQIMHGQTTEKFKENAEKWKALANKALCAGGSSDKHIDEIINRLASS